MARSVVALMAAVGIVALLSAGPLAASSDLDASSEEVAGQQIARLLQVDAQATGDDPWDVEHLESFVERIETEASEAIDIEVVEDGSGPALAVTIDGLGEELDEVCVIADADAQPIPAGRPCETS